MICLNNGRPASADTGGCKPVSNVDPDNDRARAFYERWGFERWGEMVAREL